MSEPTRTVDPVYFLFDKHDRTRIHHQADRTTPVVGDHHAFRSHANRGSSMEVIHLSDEGEVSVGEEEGTQGLLPLFQAASIPTGLERPLLGKSDRT